MSFRLARACRRARLAIVLVALAATLAPAAAAARLGDRTLQQGARGHDVRVLQDFLTRAGFRTPVAGIFGPKTLRNVKRFQRRHGLSVDGIAGPQVVGTLRRILAERRAAAARLGARVLKRGMRGADVRALQELLAQAGVPTTADGSFGPTTLRNVKRFQRERGLTVDGIVGPQVVAALTGGEAGAPAPVGPPGRAQLRTDGTAVAPSDAPASVKAVIAAGNRIAKKPYRYGGGHARWNDRGYDCSGSVSYALHGGGLLSSAMPSGGFMSWGARGRGRWITIYAHGGHMYMVIAGLRFDTSGASPSRWQRDMRSGRGYRVRHPDGL
jgi:peptidoglycan hydrolase-like protein with peptidoglycan-binding domain